MDLGCCQNMLADLIDQRSEQLAGGTHPTGQSGTIKIYALAGIDLRLTIEWQVVPILGDQHMSKQSRTSQATVDRPCRSRRLDEAVATCAGELRPHMTDDLIGCRDAFQLFGDIFAKLPQGTAAIRTAVVRARMVDYLTRKIFGKRPACRAASTLRTRRSRRRLRCFRGGLCRLQFFETELQLLKLSGQLLALLAEDHPAVLLSALVW
jgi:hypothetical protein